MPGIGEHNVPIKRQYRALHVSGERDLDISQSAFSVHVAQGADAVDYERVSSNGLLESLRTTPLKKYFLRPTPMRANE